MPCQMDHKPIVFDYVQLLAFQIMPIGTGFFRILDTARLKKLAPKPLFDISSSAARKELISASHAVGFLVPV